MAARRDALARWVPFLLRLFLGSLFIAHGAQKLGIIDGSGLSGVASVAAHFKSIGITPPLLWAWIAALVEFFGGVAILFGLLTRAACALIIIDMTVAIVKAHWAFGVTVGKEGFELALSLDLIAVGLLISGPGPFALDRILGVEK